MNKRAYIFGIIALALIGAGAVMTGNHYGFANVREHKICAAIELIALVGIMLLISKINLAITPQRPQNKASALIATFGAGMFTMATFDNFFDLFTLALK
jgi:hypothetical protein